MTGLISGDACVPVAQPRASNAEWEAEREGTMHKAKAMTFRRRSRKASRCPRDDVKTHHEVR